MDRLVELIAPRSIADALLKALGFLVLVNLMNHLTLIVVGSDTGNRLGDIVGTTVIALPFVALAMALLYRQRQLRQRLTILATTDMLTGLPNRRAVMARILEATEDGRTGALMLLDADHFKRINDVFGHGVGDACLRAIGEHLLAELGPGDIVGRVGGEEFSIFLPGASRERAAALGRRLCRAIAVEAAGAEAALRVTLSIGAALTERDAPFDQAMTRADRALYRAKAEGRARIVFWPDGEAGSETGSADGGPLPPASAPA